MMYQAVIERATGFLWYTHYVSITYPDVMAGMRFLSKEAAMLKPVLLAPQTTVRLKSSPKDGSLRAAMRKAGGHSFLFAVNTATRPQDVVITLPKGAASTWHVVSEGRSVQAVGAQLKDQFAIYAVHVYTTDPALAGKLSVARAQAGIDQLVAGLAKPGNLAFKDQGVTVTVSSQLKSYFKPWHLVDGVPIGFGWVDGTHKRFPDWLQVKFKGVRTAGRVVIYSRNVGVATVEIRKGDAWVSVGTLKRESDDRLVARFQPVATRAVRVVVTALQDARTGFGYPQTRYTIIKEVEVYEK